MNNQNFGKSKTSSERERISIRRRIIDLFEEGYTQIDIAEEVGCSRSTVSRWVDR